MLRRVHCRPEPLHSESITIETKRFFCDLRENEKGRFVKISQLGARMGGRVTMVVPARGLAQLRDAVAAVCVEAGVELGPAPGNVLTLEQDALPDSQQLTTENKRFFFDVGSNQRGVYMRISELNQLGQRQSITVPHSGWQSFVDVLRNYIGEIERHR